MDKLTELISKMDENQILEYLKQLENAAGQSFINFEQPQEFSVNIRPNNSVTLGKFKADPLLPGGYIAHTQTIRALKKDIFMAGDDFVDLEQIIQCESCKTQVDMQFWYFCPHCGEKFRKA